MLTKLFTQSSLTWAWGWHGIKVGLDRSVRIYLNMVSLANKIVYVILVNMDLRGDLIRCGLVLANINIHTCKSWVFADIHVGNKTADFGYSILSRKIAEKNYMQGMWRWRASERISYQKFKCVSHWYWCDSCDW